jgi:hypothetical protein
MATTRRQVLRGAGGFTLSLPFLPSLATRAYGADPVLNPAPRFVGMTTEHGAVRQENMFPDTAMLTQKEQLFTGHMGSWGQLVRKVNGTMAELSPVLRAPADQLTDRIVGKMNVLRGLDIPFYIAHHTGGHLGNYARNDGNGDPGKYVQQFPMPTIDQVMAWSPSFYRDLGPVRERAMVTGSRGGFSYNFANPTTKSGGIQEIKRPESPRALFDRIFVPNDAPARPQRAPVVDRVLASYKSLRESNRRLSSDDRERLDNHMVQMAELQRRVKALPPVQTASCKDSKKPATDGDGKARFQAMNDVIAAAFMCGTSRVAVISMAQVLVSYSGSWHQDVAHQWPSANPQRLLVDHHRNAFEWVFLDLARKLDVEEYGGKTYLDNTLLTWSQESGQSTHDSVGIPAVTAGSAAGWFKTGIYADYRNVRAQSTFPHGREHGLMYLGITWNRWLGTILDSMGIPRAEFEKPGMRGYGHNYVESGSYGKFYVPGVVESASQPVPFLKA